MDEVVVDISGPHSSRVLEASCQSQMAGLYDRFYILWFRDAQISPLSGKTQKTETTRACSSKRSTYILYVANKLYRANVRQP